MNMLKRLGNLIRSNVNDALDKAEDPKKIIEQTILDMEQEHKKAKKALLEQLTILKQNEKLADTLAAKASEWESKAMAALKGGNEELARQALAEKQKTDDLAREAKLGAEQQKAATEELKGQVKQLEAKINEARGKRDELLARISAADMKKKQAAIKSGDIPGKDYVGDGSAFDTFDRMVGKIEQSEAELEARQELRGSEAADADVDAELAKLTETSSADDALQALKAKMESESGGGDSKPAAPAKAEEASSDEKAAAIDDELDALRKKLDGGDS